MSANGSNNFLNIEDANLRVRSGSVHAQGMTIGGITVGTAHGLQSVTDTSNTTSNTLQFTNATTAFKATSNIELTSATKIIVDSNVVTEYTGLATTLKSVYDVPATTGTQLEVYYDGQDYTQASDFTGPGGVVDKAGGDQDGTVNGTVGFDSTYKAFTFNGNASNYINVGAIGLTDDAVHTVSLWFKYTSNGTHQAIFGISSNGADETTNNAINFLIRSDGTMWFVHWSNEAKTTDVFIEDQWYHVTYTYEGGGATLAKRGVYINGKRIYKTLEQGTDFGDELSLTSPQMIIGKRYFASAQLPFNGSIANFRLYSKALNADQVKELYDYQKDYFFGSKSQLTIYKGHLGVGVTEPSGQLELAGDERIQEYPPRGMTANETLVEGHGVFTASASSQFSIYFEPWGAFSDTSDYNFDIWVSDDNEWYTSNGYPSVLHYLADNTPGGAWLKIEMPSKIKLNSFSFVTGTRNYSIETFPENFQIWASNNGTEWNQIYSVSGFGNPPNETGGTAWGHTNVNSQTYYSMYAMVITKVYMVGSNTNAFVSIPRWKLFGTPGPTTLDKGSLTLGRSLDVPRVSRYDVDTETPRPEKLLVDFDTTVNSSPTDISGKGNHGTLRNNTTYSPADKAFKFSAAGHYIQAELNNSETGNQYHSVSLWFKITSGQSSNWRCIFECGEIPRSGTSDISLYIRGGQDQLSFSNGGSHMYSDTLTNLYFQWHHIVLTYDGANRKMYLDGALIKTQATTSWSGVANMTLRIGRTNANGEGIVNGLISNFKLYWQTALEPSEVKKLYNLGRTGRSMVISDTAVGIGKVPEAQLDVRGNLRVGGRGIIETLAPRYYSSMQRGTFHDVSSHIITGFDHYAEGYATPVLGWEVHINFNHDRTTATSVTIDGGYLSNAPTTHVGITEAGTHTYTNTQVAVYNNTQTYFRIGTSIAHQHAAVYAVIRITNSQVPGIPSAIHAGNGSTVRYHLYGHTVYVYPGKGSSYDVAIGRITGGNNARLHGIRMATGAGNLTGAYTVYTYH